MKTEYPCLIKKKVADLMPADYNPRTITDEAIGRLTKSLAELGNLQPITWNARTGRIVGGHQRLKCYQAMGKKEVEVWAVDLSEDKEKAANLALNKLAGEFDPLRLKDLVEQLDTGGMDLEITGFSMAELGEMMFIAPPEIMEDEVPEPPADPITRPGDLWILGEHRLLCGDSTSFDSVKRLIGDLSIGLMVTDPPYGVNYDADWRNHTGDIGRSARAVGKVLNDDRADWTDAWKLFKGDVAYVWHAGSKAHIVAESLLKSGFEIISQIIWAKSNFAIGRGNYHQKHEPCWYAVKNGGKRKFTEDRTQTTLWDIDKPIKSETGHSTQKPVECMARPIRNHGHEHIYDPFCGSGTTLIAAQQMNRKCYGMELNPAYCDVIVKRWETLTGKKAKLCKN